MQTQTFFSFKLLICILICSTIKAAYVYKAPSMFYSQLCILGKIDSTNDGTLTCTTEEQQTGIIRIGLVLAEYSKSEDVQSHHEFSASTTLVPGPATSFNIQVSVAQPTDGMRLSFFLVIIKSQPTTKYVDLFNLVWNPGSPVDSNADAVKTSPKTFDVSTLIFPSGTSGLEVHPFATSFKLSPIDTQDRDQLAGYTITASISGNIASVVLTAEDKTIITQFKAMVLVLNRAIVPSTATLYSMAAKTTSLPMFNVQSLSTDYSDYGPSFNSKCIVGTHRLMYQGDEYIRVYFTNSSFNNYKVYNYEVDDDDLELNIRIFCFGHLKECQQSSVYMDTLSDACYTAATCPLPIPTSWTPPRLCPTCAQLICKTCQAANRSHCLDCDTIVTNSYLAGGECKCSANYKPKTTSIPLSAQGQWNNLANSLSQCLPNCTHFITGCQQTTCTNITFCTACLPNYVLNLTSPTSQICPPCSSFITNCKQCSDKSTCTKCADGFWLKLPNLCDPCSNQIAQCTKCSNNPPVCSNCNAGWTLNSGLNKCQCNPAFNALPNCDACSIPTVCTSCVTQFYLNSSDILCHSCTQLHTACLTCSGPQTCDTCQDTFFPTVNSDSSKTCKPCTQLIPSCDECSSSTFCTNCAYFYGLTASGTCQKCDTLLAIPHCVSCQDTSACLSCDSLTVLYQSKCQFCKDHIRRCKTCQLDPTNTFLQCTLCQEGYFVITNPATGQTQCKPCAYAVDFCSLCQGNICYSCISPYIMANDGTCSLCEPGYEKVGIFCTRLAGCQSPIVLSNGTEVCIACIQSMYFEYDPAQMKCVCQEGFKEFNQIGFLTKCLPVCGDGLVIPQFQDCDDKNTANRDGCNEICKKEQDFICSMEQPSKCVLHANFNIFVFNYAYRVLGENKGILSFSIFPKHEGLTNVDWSKIIQMNFSKSSVDPKQLQYSYSPQTGQLLITVPYTEQLQESTLFTTLTFDSKMIVSQPPSLSSVNKLNGINAALTFEKDSLLSTHRNINTISSVLIALILLQFYLGSLMHKMIGLQTIQVIQSIYFVRMIIPAEQSSLLNAMNVIQYSATGYQNAELIFGDLSSLESHSLASMAPELTQIQLKKTFLLNTNISLIPLLLVIIIYLITLSRKYTLRSQCLTTKDQLLKDKYTQLRRSSQWVYDHFMFPFLMMFYLIVFFCSILELESAQDFVNSQFQMLAAVSFAVHVMLAQFTIGIYCYEAISSYHQYSKYKMTQKEKQRCPISPVQQLEHDQNNPDRPNYHPLYVFIYMLHYLILSITMTAQILLPSFDYGLQFTMSLTVVYFIIIWVWQPYHKSAHIHNTLLRIYYGTVVLFVGMGFLFAKAEGMPEQVYIVIVYAVMVLMGLILGIGFGRILIQRRYRKSLQQDNSILQWEAYPEQKTVPANKSKQQAQHIKPLLTNNSYTFKNQLKHLIHNHPNTPHPIAYNDIQLTPQQQTLLINKIKQNIQIQKQNILISTLNNSILNQQAKSSLLNVLPLQQQSLQCTQIVDDRVTMSSPVGRQGGARRNMSQLEILKNKMRREWIVGSFRKDS